MFTHIPTSYLYLASISILLPHELYVFSNRRNTVHFQKIVWIGPVKVRQSDQHSDGASKLTLILDEFGQNGCHITVIGHLACEAVLKASKSTPEYSMIEHASIVWEYLNGRNLPGLLALDRVCSTFLEPQLFH